MAPSTEPQKQAKVRSATCSLRANPETYLFGGPGAGSASPSSSRPTESVRSWRATTSTSVNLSVDYAPHLKPSASASPSASPPTPTAVCRLFTSPSDNTHSIDAAASHVSDDPRTRTPAANPAGPQVHLVAPSRHCTSFRSADRRQRRGRPLPVYRLSNGLPRTSRHGVVEAAAAVSFSGVERTEGSRPAPIVGGERGA